MQRVNADRLMRDLHAVAADVEELIALTAGSATEAIAETRERLETSLKTAKQNLENVRRCSAERANGSKESKESYFRANAWKAVGIAGGVGLLLGAIAGLKGGLSRTRSNGSN